LQRVDKILARCPDAGTWSKQLSMASNSAPIVVNFADIFMKMSMNTLFQLLCLCVVSYAFLAPKTLILGKRSAARSTSSRLLAHNRHNFEMADNMKMETSGFMQNLKSLSVMASTAVVSLPTAALADDGNQNAFLVPLAISLLTMIPFVYYANALQPKERVVRQVAVDPRTLKAVDAKDQAGSTAEARARKK